MTQCRVLCAIRFGFRVALVTGSLQTPPQGRRPNKAGIQRRRCSSGILLPTFTTTTSRPCAPSLPLHLFDPLCCYVTYSPRPDSPIEGTSTFKSGPPFSNQLKNSEPLFPRTCIFCKIFAGDPEIATDQKIVLHTLPRTGWARGFDGHVSADVILCCRMLLAAIYMLQRRTSVVSDRGPGQPGQGRAQLLVSGRFRLSRLS